MSKSTTELRAPNENWLQRWEDNNIGWHHVEFNQHLLNYWHTLYLPAGSLVLAPLCGKSRDMFWLAEQGYRIRGIELSRLAISQFFDEHNLQPTVEKSDNFEQWRQGPFELLCGDIFDLAQHDTSDVDAVYDRASLIALNPQQRQQFARLIIELLPSHAKILLVTLEYPQDEMAGPPYSVGEAEIRELFEQHFTINLLHRLDLLQNTDRYQHHGVSQMVEKIYLLKPAGNPG
ncbi:MAG: thiopurine S-methyltransferase [Candidatus Thiodiazotropha lotti]|uniref:Thiopurine S-methyltransferase n=1 Tax=Candidatus Thiodiazotropha lotti TaxID=2792787 RepID=A0A9E4K2V8_9GAMM|nr:thiopurine S-methyltransferase [Candidatus Thiodiazotropha lotti]ODB92979.1 thiopurine S-methyltransferase [Candidatus Thiodiazotropha endoloripes]MCG7929400.1 thiopurine S-methyltransferase [Candidatus Thiodiazotropha lotti]MCG7938008.1 thiopurine S-methyltransferase [Candidatus Thiodiazotropha lotti]MCG7989400.1 thiopurine S-methyltransferase [Candidatus Thiodiazotropha lotti]